MSTGLETWVTNLNEVGPLYPFTGTEVLLAIVGIATWVIWHIIQIKSEIKLCDEEEKLFADKANLEKAMQRSNAETLIEMLKTHGKEV